MTVRAGLLLLPFAAIIALAHTSIAASAQEALPEGTAADPLPVIPKIDGPIELNGRVDATFWEPALRLDPVMHLPDFGAEPSERTEFLIAHDGEYLYFGCRAYDSEPDGIQAPSLRRNESSPVNDWCTINLDTFDDGETAVAFGTTPAGLRTDAVAANDATSGLNFDWNTFWDVAVVETDEGWFAEFRIPFSSLGFQAEGGRVIMGVSAYRIIARKPERVTYPAISPHWGSLSMFKASQMQRMALEGVEGRRALHATPYALGGGGHSHTAQGDGVGYLRSEDRVLEAGLDVHYGLGPNFALDLSVNTDFAQVEADDQEVNLDRFSLFFPEKRRFFQERAAVFEFRLGGVERLFHSRTVGLAQGEPVRIYGGGRVVGRVGEWDLGLLNMHTAESELLPSENQGMARVRRRVLNESSYAGGIVTSRLGTDGSYNLVYGADAVLRLLERDYLTVNWAQSIDHAEAEAAEGAVGPLDRTFLRIRWERRGQDGLTYDLDLSRAGEVFEPGMGFLFRRDYARGDASVGYGWRPEIDSRLLRYALEVDVSVFRRNQDGRIETASVEPSAVIETRGSHRLTGSLGHRHEDVDQGFQISEAVSVPPGTYRFSEARLSYGPPQGAIFQPAVTIEGGRFFDGRRTSLGLSPSWRLSRHLGLSATYQLNRVEFSAREERLTAHIGRIRTEVMVSPALSAVAFVQYNSTVDALVANVRFRYNPREGDDLYVVWNEGVNTARLDRDPIPPRSDARTLLIKYSRTFSLGL